MSCSSRTPSPEAVSSGPRGGVNLLERERVLPGHCDRQVSIRGQQVTAARSRLRLALAATAVLLLAAPAELTPATPAFITHTIATGLSKGYQVVVADLNRDAKPDVIALDSGTSQLRWYENPDWTPHVLIDGIQGAINAAADDIDGDGVPEIALAHGFTMEYATSAGIVSILQHRGDPRAPWSVREIDRLPTAHRVRFLDIDGTGKRVLVNAPLIGAQAKAPDYRDQVPLVLYRPGDWKRQLIDEGEQGVVHGIVAARWGGDTRESLLSAGFLGVHVRSFANGRWTSTKLVDGEPSPWPKSGSSEIVVGRLGSDTFLGTIEPWHGNRVVAYRRLDGAWTRRVIDDSIVDGHTMAVGDFEGDGSDEIVVGERGGKRSVYLYRLTNPGGNIWSRHVLDDGGMAAAGCAVSDLNGDDRLDVVCVGTATANVKWYENRKQ